MHRCLACLLTSILLISCGTVPKQSHQSATPFDPLIGHWEGPLGGGTYIEKWEKRSDQYLQGEGYWIRNADTILVEDISIRKIGPHWAYIAIINNSAPTLFTCTKASAEEWVFENPEHDYPQQVGYRLQSSEELYAWTDGLVKGKPRKDEYFLKKVAP